MAARQHTPPQPQLTYQQIALLEAGKVLDRERDEIRFIPGAISTTLSLANSMFGDLLAMDPEGRPELVTERNASALLVVAMAAAQLLDRRLDRAFALLERGEVVAREAAQADRPAQEASA